MKDLLTSHGISTNDNLYLEGATSGEFNPDNFVTFVGF
jgi:hypothetical protein